MVYSPEVWTFLYLDMFKYFRIIKEDGSLVVPSIYLNNCGSSVTHNTCNRYIIFYLELITEDYRDNL